MNLLQHRDTLSHWLQDTAGVQWSDSRLDRLINLAMREVEKHILQFDPESFKCIYTAATIVPSAGEDNIYSYPVGTFAVHEIALSADGINYSKPLPRRGLQTVREYADRGESEMCFVPFDAHHFLLYPGASTAIAAGVRCIVAPTLAMSQDTDKSPLPPAFETLHILEAKKLALFDVGEPTDSVQGEIDKIKQDTPRFYLTATQPMFFEPDINRGY